MLLLQSAEFTDTLVTRLGDQLFSIVLLVVFALYMLRKQKTLEDKLDKYMDEDRREMKEVIQKNTQAFDNLSARFASKVITTLLLLLTLGSCGTVKRQSAQTTQADTASTVAVRTATGADHYAVYRYRQDTTLRLAARKVADTLPAASLDVATTTGGTPVARSYRASGHGLTAWLQRTPGGTIAYGCDADSLTIVVSRLVQDSIVSNNRYDSLRLLYNQHTTAQQTTASSYTRHASAAGITSTVIVVLLLAAGAVYYLKNRL